MASKGGLKKHCFQYGLSLLSCIVLLNGCDLAPNYKPVQYALPDTWQGTPPFRIAEPKDQIPKGAWWKLFNDPVLNQLECELDKNNPDLQSAAETYMQSRSVLGEVRSYLYPQLNLDAGGGKYKQSHHRLFRSSTSKAPIMETNTQYQASALWEADLWGKIRNQIRMQRHLVQASAADYQSAKLTLEGDLARHYMALRGYDAQNQILKESIQYYEAAVDITHMRQAGAIAAGIDVSRAENQLEITKAQQTEVQAQRDLIEHAIAVLINRFPSGFHIAPIQSNLENNIPIIPVGIPSTLLQRRPDIASAERQMAAANRHIGVAKAAFYPDISINAASGFQDKGFGLANMANSMWSAAIQGTLPLFQGGLRRASLQKSWSVYRQTRDQYRSIVLNAFREVEDNLTLTQKMALELKQNKAASEAALRTQGMAMSLYTGGLTSYLDVVTAQNAALIAQLAEVQSKTKLMQASVNLVVALGGGWSVNNLPRKNLEPFKVWQYNHLNLNEN